MARDSPLRLEQRGLRVAAGRFRSLSTGDAEGFYTVHSERPFFGSFVKCNDVGAGMVLAREGEQRVLDRERKPHAWEDW